MSISDIATNVIGGLRGELSGNGTRFSYEGTKWIKQGNGTWKPSNTLAHTIYNRGTKGTINSTDDIYGLVNRYRTPSNSEEKTKQRDTQNQGTLTIKQVLRDCGISENAKITWRGKTYNSLDFWAAVGKAESQGDAKVVNSIKCVGIYQINQPVHVKAHPKWTIEYLQEPYNNARAAKVLSGNWTNPQPWEVATNGMFEQYVGQDTAITNAANSIGPGKPDTLLEDVADTAQDTVASLAGFATILFDPSTWFRGGKVLLGGAIILIVVYMAIQSAL